MAVMFDRIEHGIEPCAHPVGIGCGRIDDAEHPPWRSFGDVSSGKQEMKSAPVLLYSGRLSPRF